MSPRSLLVITTALASTGLGGCESLPTAPGGSQSGFVTSEGVRLRWFLDLPLGEGPFPAVVFGPGSGPIRADNKTTIRVARGLNDLGFAVMRYDKRGTGESEGQVPDLSTANSEVIIAQLAADMRAVLDALLTHPQVDRGRVGLFGASQANWYMPVVADQRDAVDFIVVLTGGVLPTGFQNRYEELTRIQGFSQEEAEARLGLLEDFTGELGFSQIPILERLPIPMLYLLGDADPASPRQANIVAMEVLAAGGADLEFIVYPGGTHLLPGIDFLSDFAAWFDRKGL